MLFDFKIYFKQVQLIIFIILSVLLLVVSFYVRNPVLLNNTNLILCILFFVVLQKQNKKNDVCGIIFIYFVISAIDAFAYGTIRNIFAFEGRNIGLWASVSGTVIVLILSQVYGKLVHQKLISSNKGIMILSCSMVVLGILTAMYPILITDKNLKNSKFSLIFSLMSFSVMIGSIVLIYFSRVNDDYRLQEKINQEKEKLLNDYYNDILKNNVEIRRFRHDYKNHIRSIKYLAGEEKYDQLLQYIQEMDSTMLFYTDNIVDVGNEFVSAILTDYMKQSRQIGIVMNVSGVIPEQVQVTDIDWSIILSNCISNALEATIKVEEENRTIDIHFFSMVNKLFIEICNPFNEVPVVCDGEIKTTKPDLISHGFGIKNIKSSIEKYHGNLSFEINNTKEIKMRIIMIF